MSGPATFTNTRRNTKLVSFASRLSLRALSGMGPLSLPESPLLNSYVRTPYLPFRVRVSDAAEGGRGGEDESTAWECCGPSSLTYSPKTLR